MGSHSRRGRRKRVSHTRRSSRRGTGIAMAIKIVLLLTLVAVGVALLTAMAGK